MSDKFKKMRAAVPQVDPSEPVRPEPPKPEATVPPAPPQQPTPRSGEPELIDQGPAVQAAPISHDQERSRFLTPVDTRESPVNRGFHMYPSRHAQIARDVAYIENRKPWEIIEDALEEYVVRHYGKEHRRK